MKPAATAAAMLQLPLVFRWSPCKHGARILFELAFLGMITWLFYFAGPTSLLWKVIGLFVCAASLFNLSLYVSRAWHHASSPIEITKTGLSLTTHYEGEIPWSDIVSVRAAGIWPVSYIELQIRDVARFKPRVFWPARKSPLPTDNISQIKFYTADWYLNGPLRKLGDAIALAKRQDSQHA